MLVFRRDFLLSLLSVFSFLISGCSLRTAPATHDLSSLSVQKKIASNINLFVAEPKAIALLDSQKIVVRTSRTQVGYISGVQWADRLPVLFQARLRHSFENALSFSRGAEAIAAPKAFRLEMEIRSFEVDYASKRVFVSIFMKLIDEKIGSPISSKLFEASSPISETKNNEKKDVISEFDSLTRKIFENFILWIAKKI